MISVPLNQWKSKVCLWNNLVKLVVQCFHASVYKLPNIDSSTKKVNKLYWLVEIVEELTRTRIYYLIFDYFVLYIMFLVLVSIMWSSLYLCFSVYCSSGTLNNLKKWSLQPEKCEWIHFYCSKQSIVCVLFLLWPLILLQMCSHKKW
jgi:hypothetical protein